MSKFGGRQNFLTEYTLGQKNETIECRKKFWKFYFFWEDTKKPTPGPHPDAIPLHVAFTPYIFLSYVSAWGTHEIFASCEDSCFFSLLPMLKRNAKGKIKKDEKEITKLQVSKKTPLRFAN